MENVLPTIEEIHWAMRYKDGVSYLPFETFLEWTQPYGINRIDLVNRTKSEKLSSSEVLIKGNDVIFLLPYYDRLMEEKNVPFLQQLKTRIHEAFDSYAPDTMVLSKTNVLEYFISHPQRESLDGRHLSVLVEDGLTDVDRWMRDEECLKGLWLFEKAFENDKFDDAALLKMIASKEPITYKEWVEKLHGKCFLLFRYDIKIWTVVQTFLKKSIHNLPIAQLDFSCKFAEFLDAHKEELQLTQAEYENIGKAGLERMCSIAQTIKGHTT